MSTDGANTPARADGAGSKQTGADRLVVVGGGVTGCVLAERLKQRFPLAQVTLLEGSPTLGGLSVRSEPDEIGWDRFYHVVTPQDRALIGWLGRLGIADRLRWRTAQTGFYTDGKLHPFNTPLDFLGFSPLNLVDKARLAATILYASRVRDGAPLESVTAADWLRKLAGERVYKKIWAPLLRAKLGSAADDAAAAFIWSTIRRLYATREGEGKSEQFGFISGGYAPVFQAAERYLEKLGVSVRKSARVQRVEEAGSDGALRVVTADGGELLADRVVFTGPSRFLPAMCSGPRAPGVPDELLRRAAGQRYLGVICMVLKLRRAISPYYVLNLTDDGLPFTGVIGLTTLVDPEEVGGHHLVYLPRYLPDDDPDFDKPDEAFYPPFMAAMQRIFARRGFHPDEVLLWRVFRSRFVSPIHVLNYDKLRLPITLVPRRLYLLNTGRVLGGTLNNSQMIEEAEQGLGEICA
ncbi:MAG: FAD-dependent oxidoreductase [Polyangia bacterium]